MPSKTALSDLIACPVCDMLHREVAVPPGGRLRCRRCNAILLTDRPSTIDHTLAGAFGSVILLVAALCFPFLQLSAAGFTRDATLLDAVTAFSGGILAPLSFAVGLLVVILPLIRAISLAYVLWPLRVGRPPRRGHAPSSGSRAACVPGRWRKSSSSASSSPW